MATKTENLQLWQWEKSDPVDVEEINENFAKLDTHVKTAGKLEKLLEVGTESEVNQIEINLEGIEPLDYVELQLYVTLESAERTDFHLSYNGDYNMGSPYHYVRSGTQGWNAYSSIETLNEDSSEERRIYIRPSSRGVFFQVVYMQCGGKSSSSTMFGDAWYGMWNGGTYEALQTITLSAGAEQTLPIGMKVQLYGVRA